MIDYIDILIYSLIAAFATYIHNGLFKYNKTLLVVLFGVAIETFSYKFIPPELFIKFHIWFIIAIIWLLIIYTFYLKYNSNQYKTGKKECRRNQC